MFWRKKNIQNVQCIRKGTLVDLTLFVTEFQQLSRTWRVVCSILVWRSGIIFCAFGSSNSLFFNYETILNIRQHASFYYVYLPTNFFKLISYDNQSNIFSITIILIIASLKYFHQWLIIINDWHTTTRMILCFINYSSKKSWAEKEIFDQAWRILTPLFCKEYLTWRRL